MEKQEMKGKFNYIFGHSCKGPNVEIPRKLFNYVHPFIQSKITELILKSHWGESRKKSER